MANLTDNEKTHIRAALPDNTLASNVAAYLDKVDAITAAEMAFLEGVTAGTAAASKALVLDSAGAIAFAISRSGAGSFQPVAVDLTLAAAAGSDGAGGDTDFLAPIMGNVLGTNLTKTDNYIGGLIGHYSVDGTNASTMPVGAVLAGVGDLTTTADGAVVAYIDGDSGVTTAGAAFKVMNNNSTAASGFDFGLDLQDDAHDGFLAVDKDFYLKAPIRLVSDVVFLVGSGAPADGAAGTGVNNAGPGSLYIDATATTGKLYINTNTKASPTWTVVGAQTA